ncbi:MAG: pyruvate synthase, partial [Chloroflexota bacterium]|nr:pyruvate synthase [Chloroflexota bacterium]
MSELKGWKEIPIGGMILEAGNAVEYKTGDW